MSDTLLHLAQANVARMRAPITDPSMKSFTDQIAYVNSVADRSPGFVWRLQGPEGDATAIRVFNDERILFNMSVWESIDDLYAYVYKSDHIGVFRERRTWFEPWESASLVLWWIPAGTLPTVEEARHRFESLNRAGPSLAAFTFKAMFGPDGATLLRDRERGWTHT